MSFKSNGNYLEENIFDFLRVGSFQFDAHNAIILAHGCEGDFLIDTPEKTDILFRAASGSITSATSSDVTRWARQNIFDLDSTRLSKFNARMARPNSFSGIAEQVNLALNPWSRTGMKKIVSESYAANSYCPEHYLSHAFGVSRMKPSIDCDVMYVSKKSGSVRLSTVFMALEKRRQKTGRFYKQIYCVFCRGKAGGG